MPLKLNVGLSKKVGLPDYGSMGASCHVELELDGALLQTDLDRFHQHVQRAFVACRQAVQDELARQGSGDGHPAARIATNQAPNHGAQPEASQARGNQGGRYGRGSTNGQSSRSSKHATRKQLEYAAELAGRIDGLGHARLDELTQRMHRKSLSQLSSLEASSLIATLKDMEEGKIDPQAAFGAAA